MLAIGFALVRGLLGAQTTTGRALVGAIFGGLLALILAGWLRLVRHPDLLEVSYEQIEYAPSRAQRAVISRERGADLQFLAKSAGRIAFLALSHPSSGTLISLHLFSRKAVQAACESHGWRFEP